MIRCPLLHTLQSPARDEQGKAGGAGGLSARRRAKPQAERRPPTLQQTPNPNPPGHRRRQEFKNGAPPHLTPPPARAAARRGPAGYPGSTGTDRGEGAGRRCPGNGLTLPPRSRLRLRRRPGTAHTRWRRLRAVTAPRRRYVPPPGGRGGGAVAGWAGGLCGLPLAVPTLYCQVLCYDTNERRTSLSRVQRGLQPGDSRQR